jgi:hypothetical protein
VSAENEVQRTPEQLANYLDAYCGFDPKSLFHACVHEAAALIRNLQSSLAEKDETIAELRARCEAAERDAERYRWIRENKFFRFIGEYGGHKSMDEIIDAALAAQHAAQRKEEGK